MNTSVKWIAPLLLTMLLCVACKEDTPRDKMIRYAVSQETIGIFTQDKDYIRYNESEHQLAFNTSVPFCRIQNDLMTLYAHMELSEAPQMGKTLQLQLKTRNISGLEDSYPVNVIKMDAEKNLVWLLNDASLLCFVLHFEQ